MAVSGKGKGKKYDSDEGKKVSDKGKKVVLDKGKSIVRDDDEEEDYENEEYTVDEAEEEEDEPGYSSGEGIRVRRKRRHKRIKERFELDEDDYDLLEEANVTGFHRPANLGGKFKRLKKAGHVPGRKDSVPEKKDDMEEEETEDEDEEMEVEEDEELDDEERDEYKLIPKSQKKGGRRGAHKRNKSSRPSLGERRRIEREALASLNEVTVDSDDNDGNDQESMSRRLLDKQFESSLPEVNYFTPRDDLLRQTDVPERLQILEEAADALPSSDLELRQAAEWIFDRAFGDLCIPSRPEFQHLLNIEKPEVVRQIANVLHLVHNEKFEVPFIGLYRREECKDLLKEEPTDEFSREEGPTIQQYKALWAVQEWNKKWLLLKRRKSELQVGFKERVPVVVSCTPETEKLVKNIFRFIEDAGSEQVLDDFEAQFNLHVPRDESEVMDSRFKRPRFRSLYSIGHQAGVGAITKHFGLDSEAFGENVKAEYKKHDVLDEAFLPDELAAKFSSSSRSGAEFRDPASLIRGARHMSAVEISSEPSVREYVRTFYSKDAVVTTKPTAVGIEAIDAFHQFEGVKWINEKPISAFDDEQWLLIQKAEEEKLIDVTVGLPKESIESILFKCEQLFLSDGVSSASQSWNEQRKQILQEAVVKLLLPIMEKETRMSLVTRAKQLLVAKCGLQLWNKVSVAPYDPANGDDMHCRSEDGPTLRVLACCWGPPSTGTTFVMLGVDGEILITIHTGYLNIKAVSPEQAQRKENDKARLMKVLTDHKPHIIVLGAGKVQCRYLSQDISDVLSMLVEQHAGDLAEGIDKIKLVYGDESIPSLFETSRISQKQLPGQPGTVRRAVALGRFLQNPVAMVASLFGPAREILSIKLHPLQSFLSSEELYDVLERVMITVVNQVGIDINFAAMHGWLFETLQFVAGLGPRKAEVLRTALTMAGSVLTRNDLCSTIRAIEENVFTNCAGFVRVRGIGQTSSESPHKEPLDNTRIHPESYQMARNLAEAAIEKEARRNNEEVDCNVSQMAVEHVMKNPNILDTVDIEEYAQLVQVEGQNLRIPTLGLIKSELQRGFQEWRKPYSEPTNEECFYLMTGESEETLFPGRIIQATVRKVQEHQVMCVLECGLLGFIQKEDLSDDCDIEPKDKFTEGSSVTCRVKEVKMDKYLVDLTCKESDLRGNLSRDLHNHDKHYKPDTTFILNEQEKARKKKEDIHKKTFKPRPIVHPKFQNLSTEDAIEALAEKDVGDFIIGPSCKGPAHLSITMKVSDGLFSHIDVVEGNKESWDLESFLRLGKTLFIGDDSYKSIDEVITKYVNQVVTHLQAMLQFRKFREGKKSEIADALRSQKTENPKIIPYCFSISHEYPGAFMLSYIRATTPYHEYISLEPSGFRFRRKVFGTVEKLVLYFQLHFHDPMPEAPNRTKNWGEGGRGRGRGNRGRGRGGERGGGGGRGDRSCYKCGEGGHISRECPNESTGNGKQGGGGGDRNCYKCGEGGHISRECPNELTGNGKQGGGGGDRNCYKCGEGGHIARECPNESTGNGKQGGGGGDRNCYKCGEGGHIARECPNESTGNGRQGGGGGGGDRNCYKCGEGGHFARECPNESTGNGRQGGGGGGGDRNCYKCGEGGHFARECPNESTGNGRQGGGGGGGDRNCYKCGEGGHFARECPNESTGNGRQGGGGGGGDRNCYKCGEGGHIARECPNESTGNAVQRGGSWNDATWGDKGGIASNTGGNKFDTKGGDNWNDSTDGGGDSAWGSGGGIASNTEGDADGWKHATNAAGGGGGWDSWNDPPADGGGGAATKAAGGGGGWDSWNDPPADGGGGAATKAAGGGGGWDSWNDPPADGGGGAATNAAGGEGDWDIGKGDSDKAKDKNITKTAEVGSVWDSGTKSSGGADAGWDSVPASGGGWDAVEGEHNDGSGTRSGGSNKGRWNENAGSGYRSGGSDKGRWNENAGRGGEKTKRWGSDQWGSSSPAKKSTPSSWKNRESTPGVGDDEDGGKPASNTATTNDAWVSVTNTADGGGGWDTVTETESGGWDAVPTGDKGGHNGGAGRDGRSNTGGRNQDLARRQESSSGWDSALPPAAPSNTPVQNSWGCQSEPPASSGGGWGESPAEKGPDAAVVSGGSGWDQPAEKGSGSGWDGWDAPEKEKTESSGPDWGAVDAVADPWGSVGGGGSSRQDEAAAGNDGGWGSGGGRGSQNDGGRWESRGGRGPRNDGGRWEVRGGRGNRGDGRWGSRGGRGSQNEGGRWESRGGCGDGGRWGSRGGRGSQNDGGRWGSGSDHWD